MKYVSRLVCLLAIALCVMLTPVSGLTRSDMIPDYMITAAKAFDIDVALLYAICSVESNCRSKAINHDDGTARQKAIGIKDKSYGMFQIKPLIAEKLGFTRYEAIVIEKHLHGKVRQIKKVIDHTGDLLKPEVNAWYAAKLLRHLYDRYDSTIEVISAYNAGRYTTANKKYVNKVLRNYVKFKIDKRV